MLRFFIVTGCIMNACLIINIFSMADGEDVDREDIILHAVDNAIIPHPHSVAWPAFELLISVGPGVRSKFF